MNSLKDKMAEAKQRMMIHMANRTFKKNPNFLDRIAIRIVKKAAGPEVPHDPDLDHPE
ncbi:MAG: hypothetical protein AAF512_18800 [Pseudomonadota bacterium]